MWFTYFNKQSWDLRMWRGYNLKYDSNSYCITKNHFTNKWKNLFLKVIRTTGPLRTVNFFLCVSFFSIKGWYSSLTNIEKEEKVECEDFSKRLYVNRFGVPNRPTRSVDDALYFIDNSDALNKAIGMTSSTDVELINSDIANGLDTWMNEEDRNIFNYYEQYLSKASH